MNSNLIRASALLFVLCMVASTVSCSDEAQQSDIGCRLNSDCPLGQRCQGEVCVVDEAFCEGDDCPCLSDADCGVGGACDTDTGACFEVECLRDNDCALGEVCLRGLCETDLEADRDRDGVPDTQDSCPSDENADQEDNDLDGRGDACDEDDDNDAVPDEVDNCPRVANPVQGDADADGQGNACDDDVAGIRVRGVLDFSALTSADTSEARIFVSGQDAPVGIDDAGQFVIEGALAEPGRFQVRVEWPVFALVVKEFAASDGESEVALPDIVLVPASSGSDAVAVRGRALLGDSQQHAGINVLARFNGAVVDSMVTGSDGEFLLRLGPVDHEIEIRKAGYGSLERTAVYNTQGDNEGRFTIDSVPIEEATLVLDAVPTASLAGVVESSLGPLNDWPGRAFVSLVDDADEVRRLAPVINAEQGRGQFQILGVPPGAYTLWVSAQGHRPFSQVVELGQGDNELPDIIRLEFERSDRVQMRGRVLLEGVPEDGNHGGIAVRASIEGNLVATTLTSPSGHFIIEAGRVDHTLSFGKEGFVTLNQVLVRWDDVDEIFEVNSENLDGLEGLVLSRLTGELEVEVNVQPDWVPVGQRAVTVRVVGQNQQRSEVGDGAVVFTNMSAGSYLVFIERPGFSLAQQVVTLDEGNPSQRTSLEVNLVDLSAAALDLRGQTLTGQELRQVPNLRGANLAGVTLVGETPGSGAELCNLDLSGVSLVGADLRDASLSGAVLQGMRADNVLAEGVELGGADLSNASFFGANLNRANFANGAYECGGQSFEGATNLANVTFTSATMVQSTFMNADPPLAPCQEPSNSPNFLGTLWGQADLSNAVMRGAHLEEVNFSSTVMAGVDLRSACLRQALLVRPDMSGALLEGADLSDATALDVLLPGSDLSGADLTHANFSGANLTGAALDDVQGAGVTMSDVSVSGMSLRGADLNGSTWVGVLLDNVDLSGADFDTADLRNAEFVDVTLDGASFVAADLRNASMSRLDATGADLRGAELVGANLDGAVLREVLFEDANLLGATFELAVYDSSTQWPSEFDFANLNALGPLTQLQEFIFPNNFDARGVDLSGADLSGAQMIGVDLSGAILNDANFEQADVSGANLQDAVLTGARFVELPSCPATLPDEADCFGFGSHFMTFPFADLSGIDLSFIDLFEANLEGANMRGIIMTSAALVDCNLRGADFTGAAMNLAIFSGSALSGANFTAARLVQANLGGCDLSGAVFFGEFNNESRSADLSFANLQDANLSGAEMIGVVLDFAFLNRANLTSVNLLAAALNSASMVDVLFDATTTDFIIDCPASLTTGYSCQDHSDLLFGRPLGITTSTILGPGTHHRHSDLSAVNVAGVSMVGVQMDQLRACPQGLSQEHRCLAQPVAQEPNSVAVLGPDMDLSGMNLTGMNLNGVDLSGATFDDETVCPDGRSQREVLRCGF